MNLYQVIHRPLVTEKGVDKKDNERTLCFEVAPGANKTQVKAAVEKLFKVKVEEVRTANFEGKLRRRGRFSGYRSDWKKAYVRLKEGQKAPDFARSNACRSRVINLSPRPGVSRRWFLAKTSPRLVRRSRWLSPRNGPAVAIASVA